MATLQGKTIFITGASRGIGRSIALKAAAQGANIVIAAKTDQPHPSLKGTIHSVAGEIESVGGRALAIACDIRNEDAVLAAAERAAQHFGGIDILINNASAVYIGGTAETPVKRFDLMMDVNARGAYVCVQACLPYLKKSGNAHILSMSPPLNLKTKWLGLSPAYALSKMGMSLLTLGFAAEFAGISISCNTLWPKTMIDTDAIRVNFPNVAHLTRSADIVADAACCIFCGLPGNPTGQHFIDEQVLRMTGITDFSCYSRSGTGDIPDDIFLDGWL